MHLILLGDTAVDMKPAVFVLTLLSFSILGCGDDDIVMDAGRDDVFGRDIGVDGGATGDDSAVGSDDVGSDDAGLELDAGDDAGLPPLPSTVGGDRPAAVRVFSGYDRDTPTPLLILLHGYSASAAIQDFYFNLTSRAAAHGMLLVLPDGLEDPRGNRYWNATPACCDFAREGVDDVAYVTSLINEMKEHYNVDASRVYLLGHSNGGFMSYRMACDASTEITAIASLAGATFNNAESCDPARGISALQIHGTLDETIGFEGGMNGAAGSYPSAMTTVDRSAAYAGCTGMEAGDAFSFDSGIAGDETTVERRTGCDEGLDVEFWTINGGGHIPSLEADATDRILSWLETHTL